MAKLAILCDFDGTFMEQDVGATISRTYAHQEFRTDEINAYQKGERTLGEISENIWSTITTPPQAILAEILPSLTPRTGVKEFVSWCRSQNVPFEIVSSGYDFYIEAILDSLGIKVDALHCGIATFQNGKVKPTYRREEKGEFAKIKQQQGYKVVGIGDGWSDYDLAQVSDVVFARGKLLEFCNENSIDCFAFEDFHDIHQKILELVTNSPD